LLVERWHSSSMQTRMAFWWNSSLTPIFYQTRNKTSENQNIVKIERKTPKNKAHTHSSTNGPNKEIRAQTITRKTGGHHEHTHTKKRFITSPIRLTPPAGEREKLVAANLVRKRACVHKSLRKWKKITYGLLLTKPFSEINHLSFASFILTATLKWNQT
jgi:hypothetical protein